MQKIPTDPSIKRSLLACQAKWPFLRATANMDMGNTDAASLMPRTLQAEEDLDYAIRELRNLFAAQSIGSPLHL
jgi:hypothetical protein